MSCHLAFHYFNSYMQMLKPSKIHTERRQKKNRNAVSHKFSLYAANLFWQRRLEGDVAAARMMFGWKDFSREQSAVFLFLMEVAGRRRRMMGV